MKINAYLSPNGDVFHVLKDSINGSEFQAADYKLIHTYEIPEKEKCNHSYAGYYNNGKGPFCTRCNELIYEPIINPHMKKARPSYEEAKLLIEDWFYKLKSVENLLRDLGFEPEGEE